jgi:hypothetical protein
LQGDRVARSKEEGMKRVGVSSSNLGSVGYDPSTNTLEIEFRSGSVYQYFNVPHTVYQGLMNAASHGRYFHTYIRERYRYRQVR